MTISENTGSLNEHAKGLASDVREKFETVSADAADLIKDKVASAKEAAGEYVAGAQEKIEETVREQKGVGADYLSNIADTVKRAGREFESDLPQAATYIAAAADQISHVSDAIRKKDLSEIVGGVQDFARKQPTAFFGLSLFAGFVAIRFLKSTTASADKTSAKMGS